MELGKKHPGISTVGKVWAMVYQVHSEGEEVRGDFVICHVH